MNVKKEDLITSKIVYYAKIQPDTIALKFLHEDYKTISQLTYAELNHRISELAIAMQELPGDSPVLLLFDAGIDYVVAFLATLMVGKIAVTAYPPRKTRHLERLSRIIDNSKINVILTHSTIEEYCDHNQFNLGETAQFISINKIKKSSTPLKPVVINPQDIAFLQYTSGSTGNPKGVIVRHENIAANLTLMYDMFGKNALKVCVSWLPIFHDMGLFGCTLLPLYTGNTAVFMAPMTFLKKPLFWLQAMDKHQGTYTMAPNFSYELALNAVTEETILDLSSICILVNGAEPVKASTIVDFEKKLARFRLKPNVVRPGYGMAETTLAVVVHDGVQERMISVSRQALSEKKLKEPSLDEETQKLVRCGLINETFYQLKIVCPESKESLGKNRVGEIWLKGLCVAAGYYQDSQNTQSTFCNYIKGSNEGPFLRTGDLGILDDANHLIICGRLKDLIIINGRNIYPQDIEKAAYEAHTKMIKNSAAAFAIEINNTQKLIIVAEVEKHLGSVGYEKISQQVKEAVFQETDLIVHDIVLIPPRLISKTSSGKIQRSACKKMYLANELKVLFQLNDLIQGAPEPAESNDTLESWMKHWISLHCQIAITTVDANRPFSDYNLDSIIQAQFIRDLEQYVHHSLDPWVVWQYPTIHELAFALTQHQQPIQGEECAVPYTPVAIIGIGLRFPGQSQDAHCIEEFWQDLQIQGSAIRPIPRERWDNRLYYCEDNTQQGKSCSAEGSFLTDIKKFDAAFFNISPREAENIDPQQRVILETTWHALEDANIAPSGLKQSNTGIYLGISTHDYETLIQKNTTLEELNTYHATGTSFSTAAGRIAYVLGTQGPCMAIDTACSSSLVAVHQAAHALHDLECDLAIAGGVNLILIPENNIIFSKSSMLSPTNRCHTFDEEADGYVRGEGCGVIIMKRLDEALRDGNKIYAVIQGSAVNQDGASNGMTAPNLNAQIKVMQTALKAAQIQAKNVSHIEAHGTGTPLGDPIEWEGIRQVYGMHRDNDLYITSLKTRIGHLEAASGIAGLIKTVLALHYRAIPSHLNFKKFNPKIHTQSNMLVPTEMVVLSDEKTIYAGVSSFGFSGTNVHLVLGTAPKEDPLKKEINPGPGLWVLSAKEEGALAAYVKEYRQFIEKMPSSEFSAMCYQLQVGRNHFSHRCFLVAHSKDEWIQNYGTFMEKGEVNSVHQVAWLFTGQGSLKRNMAKDVYLHSSFFKKIIDECCVLAEKNLTYSLKDVLVDTPEEINVNNTFYSQPALFVFEYALARWWLALGIKPSLLIGHSLGEYVAAAIAGVMSLNDALMLVCVRAGLMAELPGNGGMIAIQGSADEISRIQANVPDLSVAAHNSLIQTVFSGADQSLDLLIHFCEQQKIAYKKLDTSHAFHSPMMQPMLTAFHSKAKTVTYHAPRLPLISNLDGTFATDSTFNADYWCKHIIHTVEFSKGIETIAAQGINVIQEIGPMPILSGLALASHPFMSVPSINDVTQGFTDLMYAAGQLYLQGWDLNWYVLHDYEAYRPLDLLQYPFQGKEYWLKLKKFPHHEASDNVSWADNLYQHSWAYTSPSPSSTAEAKKILLISAPDESARVSAFLPLSIKLIQYSELLLDSEKKLGEEYDLIGYLCQAEVHELPEELGRLHELIHVLLSQPIKIPFVFITQSDSLAGQTVLAALKSIQKEYPELLLTVIDAENIENELLWHTVITVQRFPEIHLRIQDQCVLTGQIIPFYPPQDYMKPNLANKTYLITGGAGALGQYFVEQLLKNGVKTIIVVGRRKKARPWSDAIKQLLANKEITFAYYSCDLSDYEAVANLLLKLNQSFSPVTSIIHAAGELNDKPWADITSDDISSMLSGKALSAWNLHLATAQMKLEDFILISSLTAVLGNAGQALYAAANGFLNALTHYRIRHQLPAYTVIYGPVKNTGLFARNESSLTEFLAAQGVKPIDKNVTYQPLQFGAVVSELICADIDPAILEQQDTHRNDNVAEPDAAKNSISLNDMKRLVCKVLKIEFVQIKTEQNWFETGMDSIMANQLAFAVNKLYPGAHAASKDIFQYPSVAKLTEFLNSKIIVETKTSTSLNPVYINNLPLSLQQQEIWNYMATTDNPPAYFIPIQVKIKGKIGFEQFKEAILYVAAHHDVFCFQFDEVMNQVSINILDKPQIDVAYSEQFNEEEVDLFFTRPFDLKNGPLARCLLIREKENHYLWLIVLHHLLADGISSNQFMRDVVNFYVHGTQPALTKKYSEYLIWQRTHYLHQQMQLLADWKEILKSTPVDVPIASETALACEAATTSGTIPLIELKETRSFLVNHQLTLSHFLLLRLASVLQKAFNRPRQGVVVFFSGRDNEEHNNVFGDISNDVIVSLEQTESVDCLIYLKALHRQLTDLSEQQYFRIQLLKPYGLLPEISFDFQKIDQSVMANEELQITIFNSWKTQPSLWGDAPRLLSFKALQTEDNLVLTLKYRKDKIESALAEELLEHWLEQLTIPVINQVQGGQSFILSHGKASVLQRNLFEMIKGCPDESPYSLPMFKMINKPYSMNRLQCALDACISQNVALRMNFTSKDNCLHYILMNKSNCVINVIRTEQLLNTVAELLATPVDIAQAPLLRCWIIKTPDSADLLLVKIHHLIMDGLSAEYFFKQLESYYFHQDEQQSNCDNEEYLTLYNNEEKYYYQVVQHNSCYYKDIATKAGKHLAPEPIKTSSFGKLCSAKIKDEWVDALLQFCHQHQVTPYVGYLQLFAEAIAKEFCSDSIYMSIVKSNRVKLPKSEMLGYFADNVPMLIKTEPNQLIQSIQATQYLVIETIKTMQWPLLHNDLVHSGYKQPDYIFNYYEVASSTTLFDSAEHVLEMISEQLTDIPLWNYRHPEQLNLMVRSTESADYLHIIYDPMQIDKEQVQRIIHYIVEKIEDIYLSSNA